MPAQETFEIKRDGKKTKTTVQSYFDGELKRKIRYRNLPCIRIGNKKNFISVPMEFCSISGNQVSTNGVNLSKKKHFSKHNLNVSMLLYFRLSIKSARKSKRQP